MRLRGILYSQFLKDNRHTTYHGAGLGEADIFKHQQAAHLGLPGDVGKPGIEQFQTAVFGTDNSCVSMVLIQWKDFLDSWISRLRSLASASLQAFFASLRKAISASVTTSIACTTSSQPGFLPA